jgi:hypothetical protein
MIEKFSPECKAANEIRQPGTSQDRHGADSSCPLPATILTTENPHNKRHDKQRIQEKRKKGKIRLVLGAAIPYHSPPEHLTGCVECKKDMRQGSDHRTGQRGSIKRKDNQTAERTDGVAGGNAMRHFAAVGTLVLGLRRGDLAADSVLVFRMSHLGRDSFSPIARRSPAK